MVLNACNFGAVQIGHLPHGPAKSVNQDYCLPLAFRQVCQCLFKAGFDQGLMPLIPNKQRGSHACSTTALPDSVEIPGGIAHALESIPVFPRPGQCLRSGLPPSFDTEPGEGPALLPEQNPQTRPDPVAYFLPLPIMSADTIRITTGHSHSLLNPGIPASCTAASIRLLGFDAPPAGTST